MENHQTKSAYPSIADVVQHFTGVVEAAGWVSGANEEAFFGLSVFVFEGDEDFVRGRIDDDFADILPVENVETDGDRGR